MITFRSYIKENMLDSNREVNYYNALAKEKMRLMVPEGPKYHDAFLGKTDKIGSLNEARTVGNFTVSDEVHDPYKYMPLDNEEAPNVDDVEGTHQALWSQVNSIPHDFRHIKAVNAYTDTSYQDINQYLYGTKSELTNPRNQEHIENLKDLISRSTSPKALTVFSGIKRNPGDYPVEDSMIHMINPAFTSTSLAHTEARGFATAFPHRDSEGNDIMNSRNDFVKNRHIIRLSIPENAHGYYAEKHTMAGGEREWILHPGARFKLWHKPSQFVGPDGMDHIYTHWYGRMVHDGIKEHPIPESDPFHPKNLGI